MTSDPPRSAKFSHVPALDGLRAIAVVLVMGYHFGVPGLRGGFLGVDLFFTLSGFLITTLLITEEATASRIRLGAFWSRHARRLLPALFGLLVVVAIAARFVAPETRPALRGDLVASVLYYTNWHFIFQGHSYFAQSQAPSPVGHLWSLAIEEQFYLLWPLLLAGVAVMIRRARRPERLRRVMVAVTGGAAIASAASLTLRWNRFDPSAAYFATDARAHELLIGAIAAMVVFPRQARRDALSPRAVTAASAAGVAGTLAVVVSAMLTHDSSAFYYHGGSVLFSLAATAAILGAVLGNARGVLNRALSLRLPVQIGAISYGLYLWHWPLTVWLTRDSTGLGGAELALLRIAATFGVAFLSYHLLEMPIRRGSLGRLAVPNRTLVVGVAGAMSVLLALSFVTTAGGRPAPAYMQERAGLGVEEAAGGSAPVIGIVGDSVASSIAPGLATVARDRGWTTVNAAFSGCPIGALRRIDTANRMSALQSRDCATKVPQQQNLLVRRYDPRIVVWYSGRDRYDVLDGGKVVRAGTPEWESLVFADWDRVLHRLRSGGADVVLVLPTHAVGEVPEQCRWPHPRSNRCDPTGSLGQGHLRFEYATWAARHRGELRVIDDDDLLCPDPSARCAALTVGEVKIRADGQHFSPEGAKWLATRLATQFPEMNRASN